MRQPTRPITPHAVLNALRLSLLQLRQPHTIGFLNHEAFVVAWDQFAEWRETASGRSRIDDAKAMAAEEGSREIALSADLTPRQLVSELARLGCVEGRILDVEGLRPEIHVEFATFAVWQTASDPEAEWRAYSAYRARLRALRGLYDARLERSPIAHHVLELLWGNPALQEEHFDAVVRILVRTVWPCQAAFHADPRVRADETDSEVRAYVVESLEGIGLQHWKHWLADLLDGRLIGRLAVRSRVIDRYRSSERRERRLVSLDDVGALPVPPSSLILDGERPAVLGTARWLRSEAPRIDERCGRHSAAILEVYLNHDAEGWPSQEAVATAVGLSPRTTWSRLQAMRRDPELRRLLCEYIGN